LPERFCSQKEKQDYISMLDADAKAALNASIKFTQYEGQILKMVSSGSVPSGSIGAYQAEESWAIDEASQLHNLSNQLHKLALAAHRIPVENCRLGISSSGPSIKLGGELGWGGARNGFEDENFNSSGLVGGVSGEVNFPIGDGGIYGGLGVSVLGTTISASPPGWMIKASIPLIVPFDGIFGVTLAPSAVPFPVSFYGFGGFVIANVRESLPPFSDTETMSGWSVGAGIDLQLTPAMSVGLKYRHFDLGNENFSVFPSATSRVSERGDMVTGTLSWRIPLTH
jgi:outer membrane immunogenic protein